MASQVEEAAAAVTATYIARQQLLVLTLTRDLVLLLRQLFQPGMPGPSWVVAKTQVGALIEDRRRLARDLAARYYVDLRQVSLQPRQAPHFREAPQLRPEATTRMPVTPRPPARDLLESVPQRDASPSARPASTGTLEEAFGLDPLTEEEAWAELERIAPADPNDLDEARLDENLNVTGIASYQKALRAGQTEDQAVDTMAVNMAGTATRLALEGAREVIRDAAEADKDAIGWIRVPDADPCSWCAMLASRGAVYRSAETAGRGKNARFDGEGLFKWHDHCGCTAVPVFHDDDPLLDRADDLYEQWLRETEGYSGKNARTAWRRYWENRDRSEQPGAPAPN